MNVLITGGAGYIGTELVRALDRDPSVESVVIYDNLAGKSRNLFIGDRKLSPKVRFVEGDILDSRKLRAVLQDVDVVYHLAAKVTTPFADQGGHGFEQVNHWGTAELVYAVEESNVSRFIYLSSVSVHGSASAELTVADPLNPRTFYGISKMRGEEHVERLAGKCQAFIIRCGNVYGYSPSMRFDAVINRFMFDANFKRRIRVHGDGNQHRSFVHIAKLTPILADFIHRPPGELYQVLVDRILRIGDIIEALRAIYPDLELLFVDQHLQLKEIRIRATPEMAERLESLEQMGLEEELTDFRRAFTF